MITFHVIAASGDAAEDLRSLGPFKAPSARLALQACLAQLDRDPVGDFGAQLLEMRGLDDLLRIERLRIREAIDEPDVSYIVVPTAAETYLIRTTMGRSGTPQRSSGGGRGCRVILASTLFSRGPASRSLGPVTCGSPATDSCRGTARARLGPGRGRRARRGTRRCRRLGRPRTVGGCPRPAEHLRQRAAVGSEQSNRGGRRTREGAWPWLVSDRPQLSAGAATSLPAT